MNVDTPVHRFELHDPETAPEASRAIREERPVPEPRLATLSTFARQLVERRGRLDEDEVGRFLDAGFDAAQVLEVVAALAMKTLSNYTNHLTETPPLDLAFRETAWAPPEGG